MFGASADGSAPGNTGPVSARTTRQELRTRRHTCIIHLTLLPRGRFCLLLQPLEDVDVTLMARRNNEEEKGQERLSEEIDPYPIMASPL
jgi:hypothetical protein